MKAQPFNFRDLTSNASEAVAASSGGKFFVPSAKHAGKKEEEIVAAPPPPPSYSEDELKKAEMAAYKKGFLEGTKEGIAQAQNEQDEINKALLAKTEDFIKAITPLFASYQNLALDLRQSMPRVAQAIAKKVVSQLLPESAHAIIEDLTIKCCEQMADEPKLSITLHASLADTLRDKVADALTSQHSAMQVLVIPNESMEKADCRIEWAGGSLERNTQTLWQRIEKVVDDISLCAQRDTREEMEALKAELPIIEEAPQEDIAAAAAEDIIPINDETIANKE